MPHSGYDVECDECCKLVSNEEVLVKCSEAVVIGNESIRLSWCTIERRWLSLKFGALCLG